MLLIVLLIYRDNYIHLNFFHLFEFELRQNRYL
jgi:hypothetical protein